MICARSGWLGPPPADPTTGEDHRPGTAIGARLPLAGRRRGATLKPVAPASGAWAAEGEVAGAGEVDIPVTGRLGGHEPLLAARSLRQDGDVGPVEGGVRLYREPHGCPAVSCWPGGHDPERGNGDLGAGAQQGADARSL